MLKTPRLVIEIYRRVRDAVKCPLTIKIRTKFDENDGTDEHFWQICETLSADGVDALVIHGRSTMQKYFGRADWQVIADVKKAFPDTTVVGSGDVFDPVLAVRRMRQAGIDGILVARGAIGNPWIFQQLHAAFNNDPAPPPPKLAEQAAVIKDHFTMIRKLYKGQKAVHFFRKFLANYCRLHPQRKKAQMSLMAVDDNDELLEKLSFWYDQN